MNGVGVRMEITLCYIKLAEKEPCALCVSKNKALKNLNTYFIVRKGV